MPAKPFLSDISAIRARARKDLDKGAVTEGYKADRETVLRLLNGSLATEIVCVLRYKRHYYTVDGIFSDSIKAEFLEHANEEQEHVDMVAARIVQLNGKPDFQPANLATRSHSQYAEGTDAVSMIKENLIAERIAIETYMDIARWLGEDDPTTRRMIEQILEKEEEHAEDLRTLSATLSS